MNIEVNGVKITLTKEQLKEIDKQLNSKITINDLVSLEVAENLLKGIGYTPYKKTHFVREKDWLNYQLETIIKAANYIDNDYKKWIPDFTNNSYKYGIYYNFSSGSYSVSFDFCSSFLFLPVGFYFKNKETTLKIYNNYKSLFDSVYLNK